MLIDDVFARVQPASDFGVRYLEDLRHAAVIKIQNVADYVFETPFLKWNITDFPNIAPPMPILWMEWTHHQDWGFSRPADGVPKRYRTGVCLYSLDLEGGDPGESLSPVLLEMRSKGARWIVTAHFFFQGLVDDVIAIPPGFFFGVTNEGRLLEGENLQFLPNPILSENYKMSQEEIDELSGSHIFLSIPFMALSFMHCKNVQIIKGPPLPQKLQKAREGRGKLPLIRWHTIVIDPVKKIIASENAGRSALTPKALHICRGHFKDFSNHGLFGKYRGTYWWPMHTRGSSDNGLVFKDYRILPPNAPAAATLQPADSVVGAAAQ